MVITITICGDECQSDYPHLVAEYRPEDHDRAISNVAGACLHVIADWKHVPDLIEFRIVKP